MEQGNGGSPKPLQRRGWHCLWELGKLKWLWSYLPHPKQPLFSVQVFLAACAMSGAMELVLAEEQGPAAGELGVLGPCCPPRTSPAAGACSCPSWGRQAGREQGLLLVFGVKLLQEGSRVSPPG